MSETVPYETDDTGVVDTSDPKSVNNARKKEARLAADRAKVVTAIMDITAGRLWLYELLAFCKMYTPAFSPVNPDPCVTAFACGMQNVGLRVLAEIQAAAPKQYLTMIAEAKAEGL